MSQEKKPGLKKKKVVDITPKITKEAEIPAFLKEERETEEKPLEIKIETKEEGFLKHKEEPELEIKNIKKTGKKPKKGLSAVFWILLVIVLGSGAYAAAKTLPRAEVRLMLKKASWDYSNSIFVDSKIADIDLANRKIPGAIFSQKNNLSFPYPASDKKYVERKASGKITIYNALSSAPKTFIATTRFETPDKKLFLLKNKTTVPGAEIVDGKIVPSSVEAVVAAEKPGSDYNIGPVEKLLMPSYAGTDKYQKIYGQLKEGTTGGFTGEAFFPTNNDVNKAKAEAGKSLEDMIFSFIYSQIPKDEFKTLDSSRQFSVIKETVNKDTDENGNFSVVVEAEGSVIAFKETHLLALLTEMAKIVIGSDYAIKGNKYKIEYGETQIDKNKILTLPVVFSGIFVKPVNPEEFKNKIIGKSETDLKTLIFSSSLIEKADISFWPFWVSSVPDDAKRVKVVAE